MTKWLLPIFTALLGYGGHWAQTALGRRHKRMDADEERVGRMRSKLLGIRDLTADDADVQGRSLAAQLLPDAELLRNKKLRQRVTEALIAICMWTAAGHDGRISTWRLAWIQDAIDCCHATLRGGRLPRDGTLVQMALFDASQVAERNSSRLNERLASHMNQPALVARQQAFLKWQATQRPWWLRTPRMWVRLIRS
ncbi:hypothetical protein [Streptomyces sp. H39-C1]|uniref:hypothetical protein n=1 Tax=Streptomyces sp. H39-C1 TaxID=3004355 RepID=UPI0022AF1297|nr:hypothetical protein [Streptomyces sp. H39-C1]MCZ4103678.1 hypothetical protein [Streptomyces sp. H39-C1]